MPETKGFTRLAFEFFAKVACDKRETEADSDVRSPVFSDETVATLTGGLSFQKQRITVPCFSTKNTGVSNKNVRFCLTGFYNGFCLKLKGSKTFYCGLLLYNKNSYHKNSYHKNSYHKNSNDILFVTGACSRHEEVRYSPNLLSRRSSQAPVTIKKTGVS